MVIAKILQHNSVRTINTWELMQMKSSSVYVSTGENRFLSKKLVAQLVFVAALGLSAEASANLVYSEPPDLTLNLALPDALGPVGLGLNSVSGSINMDCDQLCSRPDGADAFEFTVPVGLIVSTIELIISNFSATEGASGARVRNFSGGTYDGPINADTIFSNLVTTPGGLGAGTYDLQVQGSPGRDRITREDIGKVSLDWRFNITAVAEAHSVPEPATLALLGLGMTGLAFVRRRKAAG